MRRPRGLALVVALLFLALASCGRLAPRVRVINESGMAMRSCRILGDGFSLDLPALAAGESLTRTFCPTKDTSVRLEAVMEDGTRRTAEGGYTTRYDSQTHEFRLLPDGQVRYRTLP
jgi:hypothetical protein